MAKMATVSAATIPSASVSSIVNSSNVKNLKSSIVQFRPLRLTNKNSITTTSTTTRRRKSVCVRASAEKPEEFFGKAKSDASKNAENFGQNIVPEKVDEAQDTVEDVGRDMAAKTQMAADAATEKVFGEGGQKAKEIGDEVKSSTSNTLGAATDYSDGKNTLEKGIEAAGNATGKARQNFDYGTGHSDATPGYDAKKSAKETADRV